MHVIYTSTANTGIPPYILLIDCHCGCIIGCFGLEFCLMWVSRWPEATLKMHPQHTYTQVCNNSVNQCVNQFVSVGRVVGSRRCFTEERA